jgi:hypothetical protein
MKQGVYATRFATELCIAFAATERGTRGEENAGVHEVRLPQWFFRASPSRTSALPLALGNFFADRKRATEIPRGIGDDQTAATVPSYRIDEWKRGDRGNSERGSPDAEDESQEGPTPPGFNAPSDSYRFAGQRDLSIRTDAQSRRL